MKNLKLSLDEELILQTFFYQNKAFAKFLLSRLQDFDEKFGNIEEEITSIKADVANLKQQIAEYIALEQQKAIFSEQMSSLLIKLEEQMKQQEELATQSESQYLAVKRKLEELNIK